MREFLFSSRLRELYDTPVGCLSKAARKAYLQLDVGNVVNTYAPILEDGRNFSTEEAATLRNEIAYALVDKSDIRTDIKSELLQILDIARSRFFQSRYFRALAEEFVDFYYDDKGSAKHKST